MSCGLHLKLHPHHLETPGSICPLRGPSPSPDRVKRLRELARRAELSFLHQEGSGVPDASGCQVFRTRDDLVLRSDGCKDVRVPFFLSEVGYAQRESKSIVAFGRCSQQPTVESQEYEMWLIVVVGGPEALQAFLHVLSKGGVVRGDLEKECSMITSPFAFGGSSSIYKAQRLVRTEGGKGEVKYEMAAKSVPARRSSDVSKVEHEVKMLLKARGHPNIVRFRGMFLCGLGGLDGSLTDQLAGKAVLLTDYCSRGSIWNCVKRDGALTEGEALGVSTDVMSALAHIHGKDLVHRDVKPPNILCSDDGRAILTDFGIACSVHDAKEMEKRSGTRGYAAPEVLSEDSPYGKKVDVFGAGLTLFFTIYACTPFDITPELFEDKSECGVTFPGNRPVSAKLKEIVLLFLEKDPDDRPSSKAALRVFELMDHNKASLTASEATSSRVPTTQSLPPYPPPSPDARAAEEPAKQPRPPSAAPLRRRRMQFLRRPSLPAAGSSSAAPECLQAGGLPASSSKEPPSASPSASRSPSPCAVRSSPRSPGGRSRSPSSDAAPIVIPSIARPMGGICPSFLKRRRSKASTVVVP